MHGISESDSVPLVSWQVFAGNLVALGYRLPSDPGPGAAVDGSGDGVIVATGAEYPLEYIEPVRALLIERDGYVGRQLDPVVKNWS